MSTITAVPLQPVKRSVLVYLWIGILIAVVAAFLLARQGDSFLMKNARAADVTTTASGLQYKVLEPGKGGARPTNADVALIAYEGKLLNGTTFDKTQQPTPMAVASAVPGFSEALKLMPKGSKYRIWIKPSLGYGEKAAGPIPANSTLVFDVEMLDFLPESVIRQMQAQQQMQMQGGATPPGAGGPPPGQ
jgi:hypothetical protein